MRAIKRAFVGIALMLGLVNSALAGEEGDQGALSGVFALKLASADWVKVPVLGRKMNRGRSWFLVHREWMPAEQVYRQQSRLCRVTNDAILGTVIELSAAAVDALPVTDERVAVEPNSGHYRMDGHVQMWGIQNLPDAQRSPLPETATEAATAPFSQWIYDMDSDGLPGVTMLVSGIVHGRMLGIQRKRVSLTGRVVDNDHTMGSSVVTKENLILESSNPFVHLGQLQRSVQVVDPAENWFEEIRLQHDAGCQDVLALEEAADFSKDSPL